jgi:hypothetical protein
MLKIAIRRCSVGLGESLDGRQPKGTLASLLFYQGLVADCL